MLKKFIFVILLNTIYLNATNFGTIATGGETGTYIKIGNDVSKLLKKYNVDLKVNTSKGSLDNLKNILGLEHSNSVWAIVQSDALRYYRFKYYKISNENLNDKIKTVLPLYNEDIHILTKEGKTIDFSKNSAIKVGVKSKNSGGYITAKVIENFYDVKFTLIYGDFETAKKQLEDESIDIFIDVTAKPNIHYKDLTNLQFVVLPENELMNKHYNKTTFTKEDYSWMKEDYFGYNCTSLLVTNLTDKKYNKAVHFFARAILDNTKDLKENGNTKWNEVYDNINLKHFHYHPQVIELISAFEQQKSK